MTFWVGINHSTKEKKLAERKRDDALLVIWSMTKDAEGLKQQIWKWHKEIKKIKKGLSFLLKKIENVQLNDGHGHGFQCQGKLLTIAFCFLSQVNWF